MNEYLLSIYIFIALLIIVFVVDYFLINKRKLNLIKNKGMTKKGKKKKIIISVVSSVIMLMPFAIMWQLIIAFALLFGLIYALYEIYGRHIKKEEIKK